MAPRPALTVVLTTALLAAPLAARAQPAGKVSRVGVLASSTPANFEPGVKAFREALHAAGWVEGRNLTVEARYPGPQYGPLPELAAELVRLNVDVLATLGTPATLAAKRATTTIPIVMESLADVVPPRCPPGRVASRAADDVRARTR
jgi:putative ABC transport system substrate-binding protein